MSALHLRPPIAAAALAALLVAPAGAEEVDPLTRAIDTFTKSDPEVRAAVLADVRGRVERSQDAQVRMLLALGERARKELKPRKARGPEYYEPKKYAPAFPRRFVPADGERVQVVVDRMRPWDNEPRCYAVRVRYDYATDRGVDLGVQPADDAFLTDYLWGYPPDADWIIAWLEQQLDFEDDLDDLAEYFGHAYCDRGGDCFPNVTLYDVWSSQRDFGNIEVPDGDAIAFAIHILDDRSYHSPIPAGRRRAALYQEISDHFLEYYRHRSWIEAAANVYLNPEAVVRTDHENLRERLWSSFGVLEDDVDAIAAQFREAGDRNRWYESIDEMHQEDKRTYYRGLRWREERNAARWVIAEETYAVLREYGFLYE